MSFGHERRSKSNDAGRMQQWRRTRLRQIVSSWRANGPFPVFLDWLPTTASSFFSYNSPLRDCPTRFLLVHSGGLFSSTAHLRRLIAALKPRFTNSIRFLPSLVVLTDASNPRTFALLSIRPSVSGPYFCISSGFRWHFSIFRTLRCCDG